MKYSLSILSEASDFKKQVEYLLLNGFKVELKRLKNTRSTDQNSSLHLFFTMISEQLNELGMEYIYFGLKGQEISLTYTPELVKTFFWKPIQLALFETESTTKLTTEQMNRIIDIIIKFFGDKGVVIEFPCYENK
jgi:hypothetical protein